MLETIFGGIIGFIVFTVVTHPKSKINIKLPDKKIKNIQVMPRITITFKNRVLHFHHWMILAPVYLFDQNIFQSNVVHGALLGGIFQGLLYKDRFKIFSRNEEFQKRVKESHFHIPLLKKVFKR